VGAGASASDQSVNMSAEPMIVSEAVRYE